MHVSMKLGRCVCLTTLADPQFDKASPAVNCKIHASCFGAAVRSRPNNALLRTRFAEEAATEGEVLDRLTHMYRRKGVESLNAEATGLLQGDQELDHAKTEVNAGWTFL